jgi:hypothetical protein
MAANSAKANATAVFAVATPNAINPERRKLKLLPTPLDFLQVIRLMSLSFPVFHPKLELNGIINHCLTPFYQNIAAMRSESYCKFLSRPIAKNCHGGEER